MTWALPDSSQTDATGQDDEDTQEEQAKQGAWPVGRLEHGKGALGIGPHPTGWTQFPLWSGAHLPSQLWGNSTYLRCAMPCLPPRAKHG